METLSSNLVYLHFMTYIIHEVVMDVFKQKHATYSYSVHGRLIVGNSADWVSADSGCNFALHPHWRII